MYIAFQLQITDFFLERGGLIRRMGPIQLFSTKSQPFMTKVTRTAYVKMATGTRRRIIIQFVACFWAKFLEHFFYAQDPRKKGTKSDQIIFSRTINL